MTEAGTEGATLRRRLRMTGEVADWVRELRASEPAGARAVGQAILALLEAGTALGPPLVMPIAELGRPRDPGEELDYTYQELLERLQRVRRGVADIATSRKRVELQVGQLEQSVAKLDRQARDSLAGGHEDQAREARIRRAGMQQQLSDLRTQLASLTAEEEKVTAASQRMQVSVGEFRTRKEVIKATATAAWAAKDIREAFAYITEDPGGQGEAERIGRYSAGPGTGRDAAETRPDAPQNTDADAEQRLADDADQRLAEAFEDAESLLAETEETVTADRVTRTVFRVGPDGPEAVRQEESAAETGPAPVGESAGSGRHPAGPAPSDVTAPHGLMTLLAGDPPDASFCMILCEEPAGEMLLLTATETGWRVPENLAEPIALASARLAGARSAGPGTTDVLSYDAESFLNEFFPGSADEVETGAAALVARFRARLLAEARKARRLTVGAIAGRMGISEARVEAIERAGPGETEVRTLAAYVRALGGHLEIAADFGTERIRLR